MPNYKHFLNMTTDVGMLQFSKHGLPDPSSGYTLDDNARALIISLYMGQNGHLYANRFSDYMLASQRPNGSWSNFMLDGVFYPWYDSQDSLGRAVLACCLASLSDWNDVRRKATRMLQRALPQILVLSSPRAIAYVLVGLCKLKGGILPEKKRNDLIARLTDYLMSLYRKHKSPDWKWFEDYMTYCNAILPHALFSVYASTGDKRVLKIAHESMSFLTNTLFSKGYLNIVGNQGWYQRGGTIPIYDQQPVDASSIALACYEAYEMIGRKEYQYLSSLAQKWYHGKNIQGLSLYNPDTAGCYDALTAEGVNLNQGAEAILSLLLTELMSEGQLNAKSPIEQSS